MLRKEIEQAAHKPWEPWTNTHFLKPPGYEPVKVEGDSMVWYNAEFATHWRRSRVISMPFDTSTMAPNSEPFIQMAMRIKVLAETFAENADKVRTLWECFFRLFTDGPASNLNDLKGAMLLDYVAAVANQVDAVTNYRTLFHQFVDRAVVDIRDAPKPIQDAEDPPTAIDPSPLPPTQWERLERTFQLEEQVAVKEDVTAQDVTVPFFVFFVYNPMPGLNYTLDMRFIDTFRVFRHPRILVLHNLLDLRRRGAPTG